MAFVSEIVTHFCLTWRLFWDQEAGGGRRLVFLVPLIYLLLPFRYDLLADLLPVIGLLDDGLLFVVCTYAFVALCPRRVVRRLRTSILLSDPDPDVRERALADRTAFEGLSAIEQFEMYRHPREHLALVLVLTIVLGVSVLGGLLGMALLLLVVAVSYGAGRLQWARLVRNAVEVTSEHFPRTHVCVERCLSQLPDVPVRVVLVRGDSGAHTYGLEPPYTLALGSDLVEALDEEELVVVVGRELGHILFEHAFLSSLMGGMLYGSGVLGYLWGTVLGYWRRFAELSADRVALLVCGDLEPVVRMVIKLSSGDLGREADPQAVLRSVYARTKARSAEGNWLGLFRRSPMARLEALVDFDAELFALKVEKWLTIE
jgi:Zn-dependent protease with chaperone function